MFNFFKNKSDSKKYKWYDSVLNCYSVFRGRSDFVHNESSSLLLFYVITKNVIGLKKYKPHEILLAKSVLSKYYQYYGLMKYCSFNKIWGRIESPFDYEQYSNSTYFNYKNYVINFEVRWRDGVYRISIDGDKNVMNDKKAINLIINLSISAWRHVRAQQIFETEFKRSQVRNSL